MRADLVQASVDECAHEVLDVIPLTMRVIRTQLRTYGAKEISVPQFRTLAYISRHEGTSLSELADHIGLSLPSMSTLVDGLVSRGLAIRETHSEDRRRMTLGLTDRGKRLHKAAHDEAAGFLEDRLGQLSATERGTVIAAMQLLRKIFGRTGG